MDRLIHPEFLGYLVFFAILLIVLFFYDTERKRKRAVLAMLKGEAIEEKTGNPGQWLRNITKPLLPNEVALQQMRFTLARAGWKMSPEEFIAVRFACGVIGGGLFAVLFVPNVMQMLFFGITSGVFFYMLPQTYVTARSRQVQKAAAAQCLDFADLLAIAVSAGADMNRAVELVSQNYPGVLSNAFMDALVQMKGGKPIEEALNDMARWLDTKDVTLLVNSINQSRKTGTSLAAVLDAQAKRIRDVVRAKATEEAQKAPVKMVFPLMFLIMPSLFVIVMGPAMLGLKKVFNF
ncbi:MAG: type II secretion system F family protein [Peptococcaceae bacterium]|nr:type II secretion system F family protein [Peptococcaceae bacterium]